MYVSRCAVFLDFDWINTDLGKRDLFAYKELYKLFVARTSFCATGIIHRHMHSVSSMMGRALLASLWEKPKVLQLSFVRLRLMAS